MKTEFKPEELSFYLNDSKLAKLIKNLFTFLSHRDEDIFNCLDRIKHTELLSCIHKAYGYSSTNRYNNDKDKLLTTINENFLVNLENNIANLLKDKTTIRFSIIKEIMYMLKFSVSYKNREEYLKQYLYSRMRKKHEKISKFINDGYSKYQIKNNKDLLTKDEYIELCEHLKSILYIYSNYMELCRSSQIQFLLRPETMREYYCIDNDILKNNKELFLKSKLDNIVEGFLEDHYQFIISRNLLKQAQNIYEKEQHIDNCFEIKAIEYVNSGIAKNKKRGDIIFTPILNNFYEKKTLYIEQVKKIKIVKKIIWGYGNLNNSVPNLFKFSMSNEDFLLRIENDDIEIFPLDENNEATKGKYKQYYNPLLFNLIEKNIPIHMKAYISYDGEKETYISDNKNFFYLKNEKQYIKYVFYIHLNNKEEVVTSLYIHQEKIVIKRNIQGFPNYTKTLYYSEILDFKDICNYLNEKELKGNSLNFNNINELINSLDDDYESDPRIIPL